MKKAYSLIMDNSRDAINDRAGEIIKEIVELDIFIRSDEIRSEYINYDFIGFESISTSDIKDNTYRLKIEILLHNTNTGIYKVVNYTDIYISTNNEAMEFIEEHNIK